MTLLTKFARLNGAEKKLLIEAGITIIGIRAALVMLPFATVARWAKRSAAGDSREARSGSVQMFSWAVHAAAERIPGSTCLCRALAAQRILGAAGIGSALKIGVTKNAQRFQAHAWLENSSEVIFGGNQRIPYVPLPELEFEAK